MRLILLIKLILIRFGQLLQSLGLFVQLLVEGLKLLR